MDHLALLRGEVVAMAAALSSADPRRDIPWCPGWTVADLTAHVTTVHRWVLNALNGGNPPTWAEEPATPEDYAQAATAMVDRLTELAPDAPCWTFDTSNQTASFWRRRQLQEVSIHRWDTEQHSIDPEVATDGVTEVVEFFVPRQVTLRRTVLPAGSLVLDDGSRSWTLGGGDGPTATVTASTETLNLLVWGRRPLTDTHVEGDPAFAEAVFQVALTP